MNILTTGNSKIIKGEKLGFITKGIHLAPANLSGYETCRWRSKGCTASCLNTAGRGRMETIQKSRIKKTKWFYEDRDSFLDKLDSEVESSDRLATKKDMELCLRLNLTSDVLWEDTGIMHKWTYLRFYDYTKSFKRMKAFLDGQLPPNYHLTFSRSETNHKLCKLVLEMGGNVAAVFRDELPDEYEEYEVINGDEHDLRFKDKKNVWVGLIEKGLAKKDETGFVL